MERLPRRSEIMASIEGCYITTDRKGIHVLDPVFNELVEPFVPPRCITEDARLGAGLTQLERLGADNRLTVQLVLAPHGSADDFDAVVRDHSDTLEAAPIVGIEANWISTGKTLPLALPQYEVTFTEEPRRRAFQEAQYNWLHSREKLILPCEYESGTDNPVAHHVLKMWKLYEAATRNDEGLDPATQNRVRAATTTACQTIRHWMLIGQFGYWLQLLENEGGLAAPTHKIPLMLGNWHAPTNRRLSQHLGVPVEPYPVHKPTTDDYARYGELFMETVANGRATHEQLDFRLPF